MKKVHGSWIMEQAITCRDRAKFVSLDEKVQGNVSFGDSSKIQIYGKGTILISSRNENHKLITDVYYLN